MSAHAYLYSVECYGHSTMNVPSVATYRNNDDGEPTRGMYFVMTPTSLEALLPSLARLLGWELPLAKLLDNYVHRR
jgi:hypothetical protein